MGQIDPPSTGNVIPDLHRNRVKDSFLKFHNAGLFPQLKRLIIDQDDRYGPKIHDENICEFEMWKLNDLPKILEDLATIKDLQIWSLKTSLEVDPDQSVSIYYFDHSFGISWCIR